MRKLDTLIAPEPSEERNRVVAMIVARILDPRSKLATARGLDEETSTSTLVGDRGMITEARIRDEIKPIEGLDWITALRAPAIRPLVETGKIQLSFFLYLPKALRPCNPGSSTSAISPRSKAPIIPVSASSCARIL